jgi:type VI secretion system secreted protein Hcp
MAIYMKYNDGAIKGDVNAEGYADWIQLNSFQWGVGRGINSPAGSAADRESSAPSVSEIVVTKLTDCSSTKLLGEAYHGEGVKVEIDFVKTDKNQVETYMKYTLDDCLISGYSLSSGGDRPSESLSINFTKVEFKNISMKDKNDTGDPDTITYDLALSKVV